MKIYDQYNEVHDVTERKEIIKIEQSLEEISEDQILFNVLETLSIKLQNRVDSIVKNLIFNNITSSAKLINAIDYFKKTDGVLGNDMPTDFLKLIEKNALYKGKNPRASLYKAFLFIHIADAIKSGELNLLYTYRYKAIQEYLINEKLWTTKHDKLIYNAGLSNFIDFDNTINDLKIKLEDKYKIANERFLNNENPHLKFDKNEKIIIATPDIDSDSTKYSSSLLSQSGYVPILRILNDINNIVQFTENFKHFSIKHKKLIPKATTIFAGLIGKGCNIGINKIANISIGVNESTLRNTVNWCFSLKNLQAANNKIIHMISKLFLANYYRDHAEELHTGSDGSKYNVAVDSILASYSFKYFGKGKGVTVYTYLDERHSLFHSTVISSSEREAAYVIDGLLQNEVIKSDIHSVDTHGFTEMVFAVSPFINTAFAPRIKNIGEQRIYAFSAKQTYEKRGYKILPSRTINLQLIKKHWDDILRFMATIKLKYTSASQLLKRLSSYAKDHPLYKAIKEFGRIMKSIFILTYYDDVRLRQRIEKQLNKVELSNRFYNVIFFAENQEFQTGTKEEQEIATACTVLIQNAIILWNYLYLSQLIANNKDFEERKRMIDSIKRGSIIAWSHINLSGEYNFLKYAANDSQFDIAKILALKTA